MSANYKHPSGKPGESRLRGGLTRLGGRVVALAAAVLLATTTAAFAAPGDGFDVRGESGSARQEAPEAVRQGVPDAYSDTRSVALPQGGAVYVFAEPGAIPEEVGLRVRKIATSEDVFAQAQQRVRDAGVLYDHFTALDISLIDESGSEVEPKGQVYVSIDGRELTPVDPGQGSIQIQHHKELDASVRSVELDEAGHSVELETVLDGETGILNQSGLGGGSWVATFPVDGFSVYTITSAGWKDLNIQIECVDEEDKGLFESHKPSDVVYGDTYTESASFTIDRDLGKSMPEDINKTYRYEYAGKSYYMQDGEYQFQIYGLRREGGKWYYFNEATKDTNKKIEFNPQPDFYGDNPRNTIRSLYKKVMEVPVKYMDDAGGMETGEIEVSPQEAPGGKNPDVFTYRGTTLNLGNADQLPKSNSYFYTGQAYIGDPKPENEVRTVVREGGVVYAVRVGGNEKVALTPDNPLKLLYHRTNKGKPGLVDTVSTKDKGMQINLFAYETGNSGPDDGINAGKELQFVKEKREKPYNAWTGKDGGLYTGIVKQKLYKDGVESKDGFPVMAESYGGQSLAYLFDPELARQEIGKTVAHVHTGLDHLFWRDHRGYYHYDSMTNFATIMEPDKDGHTAHQPGHTEGGNFAVYKQPALPGLPATGNNAKFLPFNTYEQANVSEANPAINEKVKRYHFGMTVSTDFNMPTGGVVSDGLGGLTDMIFEFNGDDDVWVFVDGKLALDLGGIHGRYGGIINFKTGEVTTNAPFTAHSGRYQGNLYDIPKGEAEGKTDAELDKIREEKGFGKLSTHNIKFFYLERGKAASNCEIRFNLVPAEHGMIVGKRVPEKLDDVVDDHTWYQFQAEAEHPDGRTHPLANATYSVIGWDRDEKDPINGGKAVRTDVSDDKGRFWLRPGERADFSGAIDLKEAGVNDEGEIKIRVREIITDGDQVPSVRAWTGGGNQPGSYLVVKDDRHGRERHLTPPLYDIQPSEQYGGHSDFHSARTEARVVSIPGTPESGYHSAYQVETSTGWDNQFNWIDFENDLGVPSVLTVTKKAHWAASDVPGDKPITGQPFQVKIELWDERTDSWAPMEEGSPYWILGEKDAEPTAGSKPHKLTAGQKGLISLEPDQKIYVKLMPGTRYRVMELLSDDEKQVYTTTYTGRVTNPGNEQEDLEVITGDPQHADLPTGMQNSGGIKAGARHDITIVNEKKPLAANALQISKMVERVNGDLTQDDRVRPFTFQITLKDPIVFSADDVTATLIQPESAVELGPLSFERTEQGDYVARLELKHGQTVELNGLPSGVDVVVQELDHDGFTVSMKGESGDTAKVHLTPNDGNPHVVSCLNKTGTVLPSTGGIGVWPWYIGGIVLMASAGWLLHRQRGKQGIR